MKHLIIASIVLCAYAFFGFADIPADAYLKMEATGIGYSINEAIENALRYALNNAVGSIMRGYAQLDTSLVISEEDITETIEFKERILTFTKAYVYRYDIIQSSFEDQLFYIDLIAWIKPHTLENTILRHSIGESLFEGSELLHIYEANRVTDDNAGRIVSSILKDFGVPKDLWIVSTIDLALLSASEEDARVSLDIVFAIDNEKYYGFMRELEEVLDTVCNQIVLEELPFSSSDRWNSVLMNHFSSAQSNQNMIRTFRREYDGQYKFQTYYLDQRKPMDAAVFTAIEEFHEEFFRYSLRISVYDALGKELVEIDDIRVTNSSMLLNSNNLGFARSLQRANQVFFFPGTIRVEPGRVRFSQADLLFSVEATIPRSLFERAHRIVAEMIYQ